MTLWRFLGIQAPSKPITPLPEPPDAKSEDVLNRECKYLNPEWLNPDVLTSIKCAVNPCVNCQDCDEAL